MSIIIRFGIFCLNMIYSVMKLLPVKKKITYISRQMNTTPLDFQMLIDCFQKKNPGYQHIVLAKRLEGGLKEYISYCFYMFKQMYHIATSEMVILDTYCIPVSILKQRESLVVIQMWHALGAFKKFGYSILGQEEGSSPRIAHLMKMHENYTYALSSSEFASQYFAEAFHVSKEKMRIYPLPKTDMLLDENKKAEAIKRIYQTYPVLKNTSKKIIVYAPTFRKQDQNLKKAIQDLIDAIDFEKYELVLKVHPLTAFSMNDSRIIEDHTIPSLELFHIADVIVTDYSAVLFEAALLDKPIYFYAFDYETYMKKRSFYIDYQTMMPGPICQSPTELVAAISTQEFDIQKRREFVKLMIKKTRYSYTEDLVDFMISCLK